VLNSLQSYKTLVFDCDGVVLNSNGAKIDAYREVALSFGADADQAEQLVQHHVKLGGISRYPKFEYFLREIMRREVDEKSMTCLLEAFTAAVQSKLANCEVSPYLPALKQATKQADWAMISGGDQAELREIMRQRGLQHYFNAGIFGSPDNKQTILEREIAQQNIQHPALFLGDSQYDYFSATEAKLDFVFLSDWTDVADWSAFCQQHQITVINHLGELVQ
jgi:phosphoglycolate phosphatase-like HAD superfamily hydrolase